MKAGSSTSNGVSFSDVKTKTDEIRSRPKNVRLIVTVPHGTNNSLDWRPYLDLQ